MKLHFTKMHGAGNDFIFIEDMSDELEMPAPCIASMCDRHFGIGADGVIIVKPAREPGQAAYMDYFNSDGSRAQMCGNGIRCFARYLVEHGLAGSDPAHFAVGTLSGEKGVEVSFDGRGGFASAAIDMGKPHFDAASLPTTLAPTRDDARYGQLIVTAPIDTPSGTMEFTCVSMGNPHAVAFVDDPYTFPVHEVGAAVEASPLFPEKTNVEFAHVDPDDGTHIAMRVWERGDGETLACGTGCCATSVAASLEGRASRHATIDVLGGSIGIEWRDDDHVIMSGPAVVAYEGDIDVDAFAASWTGPRMRV